MKRRIAVALLLALCACSKLKRVGEYESVSRKGFGGVHRVALVYSAVAADAGIHHTEVPVLGMDLGPSAPTLATHQLTGELRAKAKEQDEKLAAALSATNAFELVVSASVRRDGPFECGAAELAHAEKADAVLCVDRTVKYMEGYGDVATLSATMIRADGSGETLWLDVTQGKSDAIASVDSMSAAIDEATKKLAADLAALKR